jgi:hypothetical protein
MIPTRLSIHQRTLFSSCGLFFVLIAAGLPVNCQSSDSPLLALLVKEIKLSNTEMAALTQGRALAKILKNKDKREVAALGIIRINMTQEEFLKRYRDIVTFKQGPEVMQIGKFSNPARASDISALKLESGDFDDLKSCKVGDCGLKLSSEMIDKLGVTVKSGAAAKEETNAAFQKLLVDYVNDYLQRGNAALMVYNDDKHPFSVTDDHASLMTSATVLQEYAPELVKYITEFPKGQLAGTEDFVYWSKEKFGLKPVISVTHGIIYQRVHENRKELLIATKQLFADHYFDSSLGLAIFTEQPATSKMPGTYLIYVNHSRADAIKGFLTGLRRSVVESKSLTALRNNLKLAKERLERPVARS